MKVKHTPVEMVQVEPICEKCEVGTYISTGLALTRNPPGFQHRCTNCGDERVFDNRYPAVGHRITGETKTVELSNEATLKL